MMQITFRITDEEFGQLKDRTETTAAMNKAGFMQSTIPCDRILNRLYYSALAQSKAEAGYRCPYCGCPLIDTDATRNDEAQYSAECGQRVELFDASEETERR